MYEDNREDILCQELEYMALSLLSNKIHVLVVGGGKAGLLKTKAFSKRGCRVTVISKEFLEDFKEIENIVLIEGEYSLEAIVDKHIVVIAVSEDELINKIVKDCDDSSKLYLNCKNFRQGSFIVPLQRETRNAVFNLHTKGGSPKTSQFLATQVEKKISEYEDFIDYLCILRRKLRGKREKDEIMNFATTEDFYFFYNKIQQEIVLNMFYGGLEDEFRNSK